MTVQDDNPAAPAAVSPAAGSTIASILALQVGVVLIAALYFGRDVLIPITVAMILSFLLTPLVNLLRRLKIGRVPSVLLAALAALLVILAIGAVIGTQIAQLASNLPAYIATVQGKVEAVRSYGLEHLSGFLERLGIDIPGASDAPATAPAGPSGAPAGPQDAQAPAEGGFSPLTLVTTYLSPVLSPFATAGIVFVVTIFTLLQKEDLRDRMIRLFGSSDLHRTTVAMDDAASRLSRYFLTLLAINVGYGVVIGAGLWLIGVPNPILWGLMATVLRFVPYVGPIISAVLPIVLAAAVVPGWAMVLKTVGLFIVAELIFNQVVEPLAYGRGTGLSTFAVIVAAIFWGWLWGPVGLILSMPLTLCLVVLGRHVERLEFLDVLLGDRPALTPVESFYQRILAGDADEAQDHAELLLQQRSLSSYYDEVALKGLQLAANDADRGALGPAQLERIRNTVSVLIGELASYDDRQPEPDAKAKEPAGVPQDEKTLPASKPPDSVEASALAPAWRLEGAVLCLAGRGPLDEAASAMLAQLLGKHGLGARVAPHQAASRDQIGRLDVTGVTMVCISYLDIGGSPSHLRYLLRRLKQKLPGKPLLVGLWPANDATLKDKAVQGAIGADYYTTSLQEAVQACVDAAKAAGGTVPDAPALRLVPAAEG